MPPRAERVVLSEFPTLVLGPGESLGLEDGSWDNRDYYFVQCPSGANPIEYYHRDLSTVYGGSDKMGVESRIVVRGWIGCSRKLRGLVIPVLHCTLRCQNIPPGR